ncbi:hypothetical protein IZE99_004005 [Escherichia coli]|nr:hypothetical protein [Escherichia coli]EGP3295968.1 hypothetical protein [Escherichia coli]
MNQLPRRALSRYGLTFQGNILSVNCQCRMLTRVRRTHSTSPVENSQTTDNPRRVNMANIYSPDEYFKITNQNIKNIVATQQLIGKLLGVIAARTGLTNELKEIIESSAATEESMSEHVEYSKQFILNSMSLVRIIKDHS